MKKLFVTFALIIFSQNIFPQKIQLLTDSVHASLRGLSVVSNKLVWVSGSNGTIGKSIDGGKSWKWMKVKGFEKTDFRDIEGFDDNRAIIVGVGEPAYILRTTYGGASWKVAYQNETKGMFLDAMDFWNDRSGIVVGDPIGGRFFMLRTFDNGQTWQTMPQKSLPEADSGEACFASSGTNVRTLHQSDAFFVSGGVSSHIFMNNKKILLPLLQGKESTGANSVAVKNTKTLIVVGGDFTQKDSIKGNCVLSHDGGNTWIQPKIPPAGYRSCVEYLSKEKWITCGLNGVDISNDDGMNWRKISDESFHVCQSAKKGSAVFLAGEGGKVALLRQ